MKSREWNSRFRLELGIQRSGIRNPRGEKSREWSLDSSEWNPEGGTWNSGEEPGVVKYSESEFGNLGDKIQGVESKISETGIRNP